jgi:2-polyprenyl-3-methyl-5-hydroxy-6-metoxy-1,4-benzoquinol methylase
MIKTVVDQEYWDESYRQFYFYTARDCITEKVDAVLDAFVKEQPVLDCFEVGCFPGRYLAHFCKKYGFQANGVDAAEKMDDRFREWLTHGGVSIGTLQKGDAFAYIDELYAQNRTFDFVYSLGLIEHFVDYMEVIKYHAKIVRPGGLMVIICPNYRSVVQYIKHALLDRENRKRHVIRSMNPRKWARSLQKEGFSIREAGCFGGSHSPYCILVAQKRTCKKETK